MRVMMRLSFSSRISSSSPSSPALKNTCEQGREPRVLKLQGRVYRMEEEGGRPWLSFQGIHHLLIPDLAVKCGRQERKEAWLQDTGSQESGVCPPNSQLLSSTWLHALQVHPVELQTHLGVAKLVLVVVNVQGT